MTIATYLIAADDRPVNILVNDDGAADCAMCGGTLSENPGQLVYVSAAAARQAGRTAGLEASEETRAGSYGFIHYGANGAEEDRVVRFWNTDRTPYPLRDAEPEAEPRATEVPAVTLFEAVALANGVGGTVRWNPTGSATESVWRVVSCEPLETGQARMTLAEQTSDGGATGFPYQAYNRREWHALTVGDNVAETPQETPQTVIPRTSGEAAAMQRLIASVTREYGLSGMRQEFLSALDTLVLMLPGGRAEQSGAELARARSLCDVYERTVCPTLGWAPRPDYGYRTAALRFSDDINAHERDHSHLGMAESIVAYAARYERGGIVNTAILDSMESNLESHKHADANQVLEALGLETLEDRIPPVREFEVEVTLSRTVITNESQTVTVMVEATDADAARQAIYDGDVDPWDEDQGEWGDDGYPNVDDHDYEIERITEA